MATWAMAEVAEGLTVDAGRMRANIEATSGVIFAERAMMILGEKLGRDAVYKIVDEAARRSVEHEQRLSEVLRDMPEARDHFDPAALRELETPERYLGMAGKFQYRLLASADQNSTGDSGGTKEYQLAFLEC
ncbi:MAG TPA: hypothetical protein VI488_21290 [Candidatus Angelobacter sp.]